MLPPLLRDIEATLDTLGIAEITVNLSSLEDVRFFFFFEQCKKYTCIRYRILILVDI